MIGTTVVDELDVMVSELNVTLGDELVAPDDVVPVPEVPVVGPTEEVLFADPVEEELTEDPEGPVIPPVVLVVFTDPLVEELELESDPVVDDTSLLVVVVWAAVVVFVVGPPVDPD